jgi:hypothetical protein
MLWAPYLFGERTPHLDPNARAAFTGITASHTRAHFVRAVMEGVAFSLQGHLLPLRRTRRSPSTASASAAAARAAPSGARFRPTSTATPSNCSPPMKAEPSAQLCSPALASAQWPDRRGRLRRHRHVAETIAVFCDTGWASPPKP